MELQYRNAKSDTVFIPGGTTLNDFGILAVLRPKPHFQIETQIQDELWKAPLIATGRQHNISATVQFTYFPNDRSRNRPISGAEGSGISVSVIQ